MRSSMVDILISLKPEHAARIVSGRKTVELRRRPVRVRKGSRVWIYATKPTSMVEVFGIVSEVDFDTSDIIWERYSDRVCLVKTEFEMYAGENARMCAIVFGSIRMLERKIELREIRREVPIFHPPQFYMNVDNHERLRALLIQAV